MHSTTMWSMPDSAGAASEIGVEVRSAARANGWIRLPVAAATPVVAAPSRNWRRETGTIPPHESMRIPSQLGVLFALIVQYPSERGGTGAERDANYRRI